MKDYYEEETWNKNVSTKYFHGLKNPSFTHWTIAYALSLSGKNSILDKKYFCKIYF